MYVSFALLCLVFWELPGPDLASRAHGRRFYYHGNGNYIMGLVFLIIFINGTIYLYERMLLSPSTNAFIAL